MALVLTASMMVGCGCTNRNATPTTMPTVLPTTQATTAVTTAPTTQATTNGTEETLDRGNGGLNETNATSDANGTVPDEGVNGRARGVMPGANGGTANPSTTTEGTVSGTIR